MAASASGASGAAPGAGFCDDVQAVACRMLSDIRAANGEDECEEGELELVERVLDDYTTEFRAMRDSHAAMVPGLKRLYGALAEVVDGIASKCYYATIALSCVLEWLTTAFAASGDALEELAFFWEGARLPRAFAGPDLGPLKKAPAFLLGDRDHLALEFRARVAGVLQRLGCIRAAYALFHSIGALGEKDIYNGEVPRCLTLVFSRAAQMAYDLPDVPNAMSATLGRRALANMRDDMGVLPKLDVLEVYTHCGRALVINGHPREAIKAFDEALERFNDGGESALDDDAEHAEQVYLARIKVGRWLLRDHGALEQNPCCEEAFLDYARVVSQHGGGGCGIAGCTASVPWRRAEALSFLARDMIMVHGYAPYHSRVGCANAGCAPVPEALVRANAADNLPPCGTCGGLACRARFYGDEAIVRMHERAARATEEAFGKDTPAAAVAALRAVTGASVVRDGGENSRREVAAVISRLRRFMTPRDVAAAVGRWPKSVIGMPPLVPYPGAAEAVEAVRAMLKMAPHMLRAAGGGLAVPPGSSAEAGARAARRVLQALDAAEPLDGMHMAPGPRPGKAYYHYMRGETLLLLRRVDEACAEFEAATRVRKRLGQSFPPEGMIQRRLADVAWHSLLD